MDKETEEIIRTNWHLILQKKDKSEVYELVTTSGTENLVRLITLLVKGFECSELIDKDWDIILKRNYFEHKINTINDLNENILLQKFGSFTPEKEVYRPTISYYKDGKQVSDQMKDMSFSLIEGAYVNELKMIIGKVFNIEKENIDIR